MLASMLNPELKQKTIERLNQNQNQQIIPSNPIPIDASNAIVSNETREPDTIIINNQEQESLEIDHSDESELGSDTDLDQEIDDSESDELFDNLNHYKFHTGEMFTFVTDEMLKKQFGFLMEIENKTFKIYLCIYKIILNKHSPYLQYLLTKNSDGSTFIFPSYEYTPDVQETQNSSLSESQDDEFVDNILKQIFEIYSHSIQSSELNLRKMYKGFSQYDENTIFVMFDATYISEDPTKIIASNEIPEQPSEIPEQPSEIQQIYEWGIMHELVNLCKIRYTPVDTIVTSFFEKNTYMLHVRRSKDDLYVESPYLLYLCDYENGNYTNVYNPETAIPTKSILENRVNHEKMGNFFMFSSLPIEPLTIDMTDTGTLRRFVVFIEEEYTKYLENPSELETLDLYSNPDDPQYSNIYF